MQDKHWSDEELGGADLGDIRRTKRLVAVTRQLSRKPGRTIGAAMGVAEAKAAYRLFGEHDVTPEAILAPHRAQTVKRMEAETLVLVAQDTTVLNFTTHEEAEGFGGIGGGYDVNHGCFLHSALAFNEQGAALGVLAAKQWSRAKKTAGKESARWANTIKEISEIEPGPGQTLPRVIHLADQEGDDWAVLTACVQTGSSYVIRSDGRRVLKPGESLRSTMSEAPLLGRDTVPARAKKLRKGHGPGKWRAGNDRPASKARVATVEVRAMLLTFPRTRTRSDGAKSVSCTVVSVTEVFPPSTIKDPLEWFLMTDEPVNTMEDALRIIGWYKARWSIEAWHKTLKSGIGVEECRLSTFDRMERFIVLAAILAWRMEWLARVAREQPDTPAEALFDSAELEFLKNSSRSRKPLLTLRDAIRAVAMLGGFAGTKGAGEPGTKTLWRGWLLLMVGSEVLQNYLRVNRRKDVGRS